MGCFFLCWHGTFIRQRIRPIIPCILKQHRKFDYCTLSYSSSTAVIFLQSKRNSGSNTFWPASPASRRSGHGVREREPRDDCTYVHSHFLTFPTSRILRSSILCTFLFVSWTTDVRNAILETRLCKTSILLIVIQLYCTTDLGCSRASA